MTAFACFSLFILCGVGVFPYMFVYMTCICNDDGDEGEDLLELVLPTSLSQQVAGVGECRPCRRVDSALNHRPKLSNQEEAFLNASPGFC